MKDLVFAAFGALGVWAVVETYRWLVDWLLAPDDEGCDCERCRRRESEP